MNSFISKYKSYAMSAGLYMLASLIPALLSLVTNPWIAKNMTPSDYAVVSYYTSFNSLFTPIIGFFAIDYYLRRYYRVSEEERFRLKGNIIKFFLLLSGLTSALCLLGLFVFVTTTDVSFPFLPYAPLTLEGIYIALLYSFQLAEYRIAGESRRFFVVSLIWGITTVVLNIVFVVILKGGGVGKTVAAFLGNLLPFIWCFALNRKYLSVRLEKKTVIDIIHYGLPLALAAMLNFVTNGYDKVLLERSGDIEGMGYYAVACHMSGMLMVFSTAIKSTFQPDAYKAIAQKSIKKVMSVSSIVIVSVLVVVLLYIYFCPWIVDIFTAGRYINSTGLTRITCWSILTSTIYFQIAQFTYGTGLTKITLINKVIGSVLSIGILTLLIGNFGVVGAAWGMVIGYLVFALGNITLLFFYRKKIFHD